VSVDSKNHAAARRASIAHAPRLKARGEKQAGEFT
jgi:hypothetical protein